jgi:hypothetical protein
MMVQEVKAVYNTTELELYAIAELGYNNLQTDLVFFAAKKPKYTPAYLDALRLTRTNAIALPDEEARNVNYQVLRNNLSETFLPPILDNFNDLKGYIKDAWPGEKPEPRYEAAGGTKYAKAAAKNWENVIGLNSSMQTFITANNANLTAPGGMPATFVTKVNSDAVNFTNAYELFAVARETGVARAEKVIANNLLHSELMSVMEDGVMMVYRNDAAKKKNYVFDTLKDIVSPPGSASLRVLVLKDDDSAVANVAVKIKKELTGKLSEASPAITVLTDDKGVAMFENADPGKYEGEVTVDEVKKLFTKEINTGVKARLTVGGSDLANVVK